MDKIILQSGSKNEEMKKIIKIFSVLIIHLLGKIVLV